MIAEAGRSEYHLVVTRVAQMVKAPSMCPRHAHSIKGTAVYPESLRILTHLRLHFDLAPGSDLCLRFRLSDCVRTIGAKPQLTQNFPKYIRHYLDSARAQETEQIMSIPELRALEGWVVEYKIRRWILIAVDLHPQRPAGTDQRRQATARLVYQLQGRAIGFDVKLRRLCCLLPWNLRQRARFDMRVQWACYEVLWAAFGTP